MVKYFKDHLGGAQGVWLPDSFGYHRCMVRRSPAVPGTNGSSHQKISWNDTASSAPLRFMWEGIDGSRIFTHFPPADTYAAFWCKVQELDYAGEELPGQGSLSDRSLMLFGFGDGGGGPTRNMMEHSTCTATRTSKASPGVSVEEPNDFFDKAHRQLAENAGPEMPVWKGELYLELHRAHFDLATGMKRGCRQEESLLRTVEYWRGRHVGRPELRLSARRAGPYLEDPDAQPVPMTCHTGSAIAWVHREAHETIAAI